MMLLKCKFHMERSGFTLSLLLPPFPADACQPPLSPDPNSRKCRARYGLDQQQMWCGPCRLVGSLLYTLSQIHCHVYSAICKVTNLWLYYQILYYRNYYYLFLSSPPHQSLLPAPTFLPSSLLPPPSSLHSPSLLISGVRRNVSAVPKEMETVPPNKMTHSSKMM